MISTGASGGLPNLVLSSGLPAPVATDITVPTGTFQAEELDFKNTRAQQYNLFAEKAYPQQSEQAFATYHAYVERGKKIPNLRYVGRHAEFKYWGMPETVNSAYLKALEFEPV